MEYSPGESNIGPKGRQSRSLQSIAGLSGYLLLLVLMPNLFKDISGLLGGFIILYYGFYSFFQAEDGFCGTYAALGLHRDSDGLKRTDDSDLKKADRSKSLQQNINSFLMALGFLIWSVALYSM